MKKMTKREALVFCARTALGFMLLADSQIVGAQVPQAALPASAATTPLSAPVQQPTPQVGMAERAEQLAVCTKVKSELAGNAQAEMGKVVMHVTSNDIWLAGSPFVVFELGTDNKLTGTWLPCAPIRRLDSLPDSKPKPPYYEVSFPALLGVSASCPKQPPGPLACKAALADHMAAKGLVAIGMPRITDDVQGPNQISTIWVPYAVKPKAPASN